MSFSDVSDDSRVEDDTLGTEETLYDSEQLSNDGEEAEEEADDYYPLTEDMVIEMLSTLQRLGNGWSHAYVKFDAQARALSEIDLLKTFIHLRFVNLSQNKIHDASPLANLNNILTLNLESNKLQSLDLGELPFLQIANFSSNRLTSLHGIAHPMLEKLYVSNNRIEKVLFKDAARLSQLRILDLRGNKLTTTFGMYPPNIEELYLAENLIEKLDGLQQLTRLQVLHLRDNQIQELTGLSESLVALKYVNLRGNSIDEVKEAKKIQCLPGLQSMSFLDNPVTDEKNYRAIMCAALGGDESALEKSLDKDKFDEDDISEAKTLIEEEKKKLETEENSQQPGKEVVVTSLGNKNLGVMEVTSSCNN